MAILREWVIVRRLDDPEESLVARLILPANLPGAEDYLWSEADKCAMPVTVAYRDLDAMYRAGEWIATRHPTAKSSRTSERET